MVKLHIYKIYREMRGEKKETNNLREKGKK